MYNECNFLTSRHKITLDKLTCHENQSNSISDCLENFAEIIEI